MTGSIENNEEWPDLGARDARGQWQPAGPKTTPPLFAWPPRPLAVLRWLFGFPGYLWPWTALYILIAVGTWLFLQPEIARCTEFETNWIAQLYVRNLVILVLIAGAWHLRLYTLKAQGLQYKYDAAWPSIANRKFLWGHQLWDNVFWSCASGVTVWTAYEALMFWAYANELIPYVDWREDPLYFTLLLIAIPLWRLFHFYWVHRLTHWKPLYRAAHYLHHKNINVGPWSGLAMHPIEHLLYFSCILIHWIIPSHPLHVLFNAQHAAFTPAQGHVGFDQLVLTSSGKIPAASYFHQLHHRYFECNYGETDIPFDLWFGTYHDGSPESHHAMREKRRSIHSIQED